MKRVLLVFEYPTLNGGERSLLAVLPTIQQAGWEVEALCPTTGPLAESLHEYGVRLPSPRTRGEGPGVRGDLQQLLDSRNYDLLHANSLAMGRMSGPIVAAAGVPSIAHLRDIIGLKPAAVADLNRHSRLLAVSQATREHHITQGLSAEKTFVAYNGIDLETFQPRREAQTNCTIGIIGQIILRKGQDVALHAAVAAMQTRSDVEVFVIGARHSEKPETQEYEARLHAIVTAAGMTDRVRFLGTRDDLPTLLPRLTVLLHTPRQEPLGRVLIEAAACGVPVVATNVGGTREIFPREADDGAILAPVDDVPAIERALATVLDDDGLQSQMSAAGRRRAEAAFSVERAAAELLRHYDEVARLGYNAVTPKGELHA
jgi:glycosyltransferase involved in cell wall biosynthesis